MKNNKFNLLIGISIWIIIQSTSCQNKTENNNQEVVSATDSSAKKPVSANGINKPENPVNDFENILDQATIDTLNFLLNDFDEKTAVQIFVVTTANFSPFNSIDEYSIDMGNKWGVGLNEVNNGILVVVSSTLRQVRISTGLGMEQLLADTICKQIVNEKMLPEFKKANYPLGIKMGVKEIMRHIISQAV